MKHLTASHRALAADSLRQLSVCIPEDSLEVLLRHIDWLLETSRAVNLTRILDPSSAVRLHLVDALTALPEVRNAPPGLLIDIGTGGGVPGVELAIAAGREALLVDSVRKKCALLSEFLLHESLDARISVRASRVEELDIRACSAVVTARGVTELPALIELARPLLASSGLLVAMKARPTDDEVARGVVAARICGMKPFGHRRLRLPGGDEERTIITYQVIGPPEIELPRRTGLAQKRPLA